jgi:hypothetical protein
MESASNDAVAIPDLGCLNEDAQRALVVTAKVALRILTMWKLDTPEKLTILGASAHGTAALVAISEDRYVDLGAETFKRCELLIKIFRALIGRRPDHNSFTRAWIHSPNEELDWHSPVDLIKTDGRKGLQRVLCMLDAHDNTLAS